ncbi:sugar phosphate isomerase/epimerase family protein [Clostridium sp. Marseille-P3244]|uniref:sugar phosphate isomerase/epimerase family protein n=1 Tax=Clostridium sp. Marseille-P3244 TaxID=1871020 RepID=UPI00093084EF|nr:sugar phosphate isomerase/epimerase family protein [Clostridium sp. Marseille-P3244]
MKRSQIAAGNFTYKYFPFTDFLDSMERLGLRKIELWSAEPHLYFEDYNYAQMTEIARKIRNRNLEVCCVTPEQYLYPVNIASLNPDTRKRSINYFKRAIDVAAELEAPKVLVSSGQCPIGGDREECRKRMLESLAELAHNACFKGTKIVFEPLPRKIDLIRRTEEVKTLLDEVGFYDGIGALMDFDISLRAGDTAEKFIRTFGRDFIHVHLNDGKPGGHMIPGEGVLPVEQALKELQEFGYQGDISFEVTDESVLLEPEEAMKKSLRFLEKTGVLKD